MSTHGLHHQVRWTTATLSDKPIQFGKVVFFAGEGDHDKILSAYQSQLAEDGHKTAVAREVAQIASLLTPDAIVVHIPQAVNGEDGVYEAANKSCNSLIAAAQLLQQQTQANRGTAYKLFSVITKDSGLTELSYAPLYGLARALKMEIPELFGGLIEEDEGRFPLSAIKHAQGFDVVKVLNGVAHTARLQPFQDETTGASIKPSLDPKGTYLITGGTRGIGLEIASWMGERGARNIVLVSRRGLPADKEQKDAETDALVARIAHLRTLGADVNVLAIDISKPDADLTLRQGLDKLSLPPVKGVVHAAGVAGYRTLERCTPSELDNDMAPKVLGALHLDKLFPPGTLDFFILTSSVGQLVGFSGQLSYAPSNSFLEGLAARRRRQGDNSTSILWTCWNGVGMMAQSKSATRMITTGMQAKGLAIISKEEALAAFDGIFSLKSDHVAVVRALALKKGDPPRHPVLWDITPQKDEIAAGYPEHAVAIVGMACRTAAGDTADDLWQAISTGKSMVRDLDPKRFPDAAGKSEKLVGNFLRDTESFDHQFFKKSKRESAALDPHQRLLLETTYHALESAGCFGGDEQQEAETHDVDAGGEITGCFIGMNAPDYPLNLACNPSSPYTGFGMLRSFVAGRLSHHFGWTGPSQTIDTACSSAMVAIHQAVRAIQVGECTRAITGGANLITNTALFDALRTGGFLSKTGPCKTFDARADGYCRGEAVGIMVLKPVARAIQDGDDIHAVLLATGNNQNINNTSITNPVLNSQKALFSDVLLRAGVSPTDVSYVEAHGTGTRAGDPVEVEAIRQVFGGPGRSDTLHIGAVKPNVGHSEGASGAVSLIKVLLMMRHGQITPQAQFQTLNPNIPALEPDRMAISTTLKEWKDDLRLALVSSYGASGNNAATVVAPPPPRAFSPSLESKTAEASISKFPIFISAGSKPSLSAYFAKLKSQIDRDASTPEFLKNLAYTLAKRQNRQLQHFFSTTVTSINDLQTQLANPQSQITTAAPKPKSIVLLFSGQNGNVVPPAKDMYESSLLFRSYVDECDEAMRSLGLPSVLPAVLEGVQEDGDLITRHAAMFAIQYSSGMSWIASGVKPQAITGHSFGEWAALTVSGAITLKDGVRIVTGRASLIEKLWGADPGSMVAIEADLVATGTTAAQNMQRFNEKHPDVKLDIACYNGPNNYVVAGRTPDIELLEAHLNERKASGEKLRFKVLKGMHAYHSVMADPIVEEAAVLSASVPFKDPIHPFESCHEDVWTGPGPNVVARNTRGTVYFGKAISRIIDRLGPCTFLEAGFGGPIVALARNAIPQVQAQEQHGFVPINGKDPVRSLADATVALWKNGHTNVQFWPFHRSQGGSYVPVNLPQYQFEKHDHWLDYTPLGSGGKKEEVKEEVKKHVEAPVSGFCPHCHKDISLYPYIEQQPSQSGAGQFVFKVDTRSKRYQDLVSGHIVVGSPLCPAAIYLELCSHAVSILNNGNPVGETMVDVINIKAPLGVDPERSVRLSLTKKTGSAWDFELASFKNNEKPTSHATGTISLHNTPQFSSESSDKLMWDRLSTLLENDPDTEALRGGTVYKIFNKMGNYSPPYKGLKYLVGKAGKEGAGEIDMPPANLDAAAKTPNENIADPLLMDNILQVPGIFVHSLRGTGEEEESHGDTAFICTGMGSVGPLEAVKGTGKYRAYTRIVHEDSKETILDVFGFGKDTGKLVWSAKGLKFSKVPRSSLAKVIAGANPHLSVEIKEPAVKAPVKTAVVQAPTPKISYQSPPAAVPVARKKPKTKKSSQKPVLPGVQQLLSKSLDIPVEDIIESATLEDLGTDSLVTSEILASISDTFKVDISNDEFTKIVDVASLCAFISARVGGESDDSAVDVDSQEEEEYQQPEPTFEPAVKTASKPSSAWRQPIFDILSHSLDVPVEEIQMDSGLEDLGADSLVASEIISNLNEAFNIDISNAEFTALVDVASLCKLIGATLGVDSAETPTSSSQAASHGHSASSNSISMTPYTGATTPAVADKSTVGGSATHRAFQQVRRNFDAHAKETKFTGYWNTVYPPQLETVAAFITEGFAKLGCNLENFKQGDKLPALQETLAKYHREVPRLWDILEEAGIVEKTKTGDYVRGPTPLHDQNVKSAVELSADLIARFPQYASTHGLPDLLGPHLAECLTGKADAVSLLFGSDKGRLLLEDFYANGPDLLATTRVLCDFVSAAIHLQTADGEPFRILEVGAGTGGTTKHLIPLLQATGLPFTYTFTELSPSLLARAKKTFKGVQGMDFRKLNIEEQPPQELLGKYHMVVSSNCVHATRDLRRCVTSIRKMVRNDGCVALVELAQKLAWYDLVWGLLDGWWLFDDGRTYALQSPWAWEQVMKDSGFAHVDWSEGSTRESRGVRVVCGMVAEPEKPCPTKATSTLLHRGSRASGGRNVFLAPDGFGSGAVFGALGPLLDRAQDVSVYALNSPFLKNKPDAVIPTIEELAAIYVGEIKRRQPEGPYLLGGYSVGGVVAYEAARQLLEDGSEVEKLFLIDTACPTFDNSLPDTLCDFLDSIAPNGGGKVVGNDHFTLARQQVSVYQVSKLPTRKLPQVVLVSAKEGADKQNAVSRPEFKPTERKIAEWFLDDRADGSLGWDEIFEGVNVVRADGNHFSMMSPAKVNSWASTLAELL
ncbi:polyketide synthase module [Trichoderma chlorosporum]